MEINVLLEYSLNDIIDIFHNIFLFIIKRRAVVSNIVTVYSRKKIYLLKLSTGIIGY